MRARKPNQTNRTERISVAWECRVHTVPIYISILLYSPHLFHLFRVMHVCIRVYCLWETHPFAVLQQVDFVPQTGGAGRFHVQIGRPSTLLGQVLRMVRLTGLAQHGDLRLPAWRRTLHGLSADGGGVVVWLVLVWWRIRRVDKWRAAKRTEAVVVGVDEWTDSSSSGGGDGGEKRKQRNKILR